MTPPKISFCIPAYNGARFLPGLIERLAAFPRHSFEIILLDDSSKDDTVAVATRLATQYPMLQVHRQAANVGFMRNFAAVCHLARGEYIYPISQDDHPMVEGLANGVDRMDQDPAAAAIFGSLDFFRETDGVKSFQSRTSLPDDIIHPGELHRLFQSYFYELEYGIMRRSIFQRFYYNEGHVLPVGWYLLGCLGRHGNILLSSETMLDKRTHEAALTASFSEPWFQELARRDLESFLSMMEGIPAAERLKLLFQKQMSLYLHGILSTTQKGKPVLARLFMDRLRGYGYWTDENDEAGEAGYTLAAFERLMIFIRAFPDIKEVATERSITEYLEFDAISQHMPIGTFVAYDRSELIKLPDAPDRLILFADATGFEERSATMACDPSRQRAFADFVRSLKL